VVSLAAWLTEHASDPASMQAAITKLPPKLLLDLTINTDKLATELPDPDSMVDVSSLIH
jgi:hypothetical protein